MMRTGLRLEDAIVYVLATAGHGMSTAAIAFVINQNRIHTRRDGRPVTDAQIYAAIMRHPSIFIKEGRLIHLLM